MRAAAACPPVAAVPLRDDLILAAAGLGATLALYVPAIGLVVGRMSADLALFLLFQQLEYATYLVSQIIVLRLIGRHAPHCPAGWQFLTAATASAVAGALPGAWDDAYAVRLGLVEEGSNAPRMVAGWTCLMLAAFLVWAREGSARRLASMQRLQRVQQAQLAARRALVDTQLRAMQARVDPEQLFAALGAIERLYPADPARGDALFEALVHYLRAAVPRVDSVSSMLGHEIALATACASLNALCTGRDITLAAEIEAGLRTADFPAGLLLPLVAGALEALPGGGRIGLAVRRRPGGLALALNAPCAPAEHRLRQARDSLQALHGHAAGLTLTAGTNGPALVLIDMPHGHD